MEYTVVQLYEEYHARLLRTAKRLIYPKETAEDIVSNVWSSLLECEGGMKWKYDSGKSAPFPFLYLCLKNKVIDYRRKEKGRISLDSFIDVLADAHPIVDDSGDAMISSERAAIIAQAFKSLPDNYRRAIELFCLEEKSGPECAQHLGITKGLFRIRLMRAKELLREAYQSYHPSKHSPNHTSLK